MRSLVPAIARSCHPFGQGDTPSSAARHADFSYSLTGSIIRTSNPVLGLNQLPPEGISAPGGK